MQVGVDEALAAPDVVHAAEGGVSSVGQREPGLFLRDAADALVAQVSVQKLLA